MTIDSTQETIRVMVLDGLGLSRASLSRFLASAGLEVTGECGSADEALELLKHSTADVLLLDLDLPEQPDALIATARAAGYQGRFLGLTAEPELRKSAAALKAGASGIFLKSDPPERLVQAIHAVAHGDVWIDQRVLQALAGELIERFRQCGTAPVATLDDRERSVLNGIIGGLSNRTIGEGLGLSESSVKNTVQRLFHKGGVKTRSQLVRMALEGSLGGPETVERHTNGTGKATD